MESLPKGPLPVPDAAALAAAREEYKEAKARYKKSTFCYYYWRQRCIFPRERCKFAHGIEDLKRYPRSEFLQVRSNFFRLKAATHGKKNPEGLDPNPKESKVDDLVFSSDEEESKVFKAKHKARSKAEHDKLKEWQNLVLRNFALFILHESPTEFVRRSHMEHAYHDVKLKFEPRLLTERMRAVYVKTVLLPPSLLARTQVVLAYPELEKIADVFKGYLTQLALAAAGRGATFPIHYKEFERTYAAELPLNLPDISLLYSVYGSSTDHEFTDAINHNQDLIAALQKTVGDHSMDSGFLTAEDCTPAERARLEKRLGTGGMYEWAVVEKACEEECAGTLQYFVAKDRPTRNILWSIGFKFILTGSGSYAVRTCADGKEDEEFKILIQHEDEKCNYGRIASLPPTDKTEEDPVPPKGSIIDGKIVWVDSPGSLEYAMKVFAKVTQVGVDTEGCLSVLLYYASLG